MIEFTNIPTVTIDMAKVRAKIRPFLIEAMDKSADELLKQMRIFATKTTIVGRTGKGGPGDVNWRRDLASDIHRLFENITDSMLEYGVGVDYTEAYMKVRANIIDLGSGSAVEGGKAIHAGPPGRQVWNDELTGKHGSDAQERMLPSGFNHPGNDYVTKALDATEPFFQNAVAHALDNAPDDLLVDCLVTQGG